MRRIISVGPALVVLASTAVVLYGVPAAVRRISAETDLARVRLAQQSLDADDTLERVNRAVRAVNTAVEPSLAHITIIPQGDDDGRRAHGSGWVWDADGNIVTNAHVIAGAGIINVQFPDGRVLRAKEIDNDPQTDVAVIKVETDAPLMPMRRASGQRLYKGDRVYAFGSPFEFKYSMSEGIVSGLGRSARTAMGFAGFSNFIQTDAAVNPGNSGGPLVDIRGRLVGMNVAIANAENTAGMAQGQSAGISFAIPLAVIESRVEQMLAHQEIESGYLGVTFSGGEGISTGSIGTPGVPVGRVSDGSPAADADLRENDIIISIDGEPVTNGEVLRSIISATRPGKPVALQVVRNGQILELHPKLGAMPRELVSRQYQLTVASALGLGVRDLDEGATVSFLRKGEPAEIAGLREGQVIQRVAGDAVRTADEFARALVKRGVLIGRPVRIGVIQENPDGSVSPRQLIVRVPI